MIDTLPKLSPRYPSRPPLSPRWGRTNPFMMGWNPYGMSSIAARYSLDGATGDSTYLLDGSSNVSLVADRSGNSATNCLPANGVSGNNASTPDVAANRATTQVDLRVRLSAYDWTATSLLDIFGKYDSAGNLRSYIFSRSATAGCISLFISSAGTASESATSSTAVSFSNNQIGWIRVTWRASDQRVQFFIASDSGSNAEPSSWSQLGTNQTMSGAVASLFSSSTPLRVGGKADQTTNFPATYFYASIRKTIDSASPDQIFDPSGVAKLATSFVSSTGETWTINTSGDTGARICGARDLVQMTASKRPAFSVSGGRNIATFDGSNDYWKTASFTFTQPESFYLVASQTTWTGFDTLLDGDSAGGQSIEQDNGAGSPNLALRGGGAPVATNNELSLTTRAVITAIFNGASSALRINKGTATTGTTSGSANAITIGSQSDGTEASNMVFAELVARTAADADATQLLIIGFLMRKWGVS